MTSNTELRTIAHSYIDRGWAVMLLSTDSAGGKIPPANCPECSWQSPHYVRHVAADCQHLLCHGFYAATKDHNRFDQMLDALPHGQLAVRTGRASRLLVIDAEATSKHEGEPTGLEVLEQWQTHAGVEWDLPQTLSSRSVKGGLHLFYDIGDNVEIGSGRILPNIDVKSEYGYVGVPSGQTARAWIDLNVQVKPAPSELIKWLQNTKRRGTNGPGQGGQRLDGYDFQTFLKDGCPDGHRDFFFNDLAFQLRKSNTSRSSYEEQIWIAWTRAEQPPNAQYEMPWEHVAYKMDRVWATVQPDPPSVATEWATLIMRNAAQRLADNVYDQSDSNTIDVTAGDDGVYSDPPNNSPLVVGELDPDHWYGTNDDATAARLYDMWGDWFRAVPRARGGYAWLLYDGVIWSSDPRERIWSAIGRTVEDIENEVDHWTARATELAEEGVENWLTQVIGGTGQNAGQFARIIELRKYASACRENARKQTGVTAFARLEQITVTEEDLDAQTRYIGLRDGQVLDVHAVHNNRPRVEWTVPANPDMLLTKKLGCGLVTPSDDVPGTLYEVSNFRTYLENTLPDKEVRATLQEIVGYALLGDPTEKIIVLLHGKSDSGKTVLLEVLEALFGDYSGWTDGQALIAGKAKSAHSEWLNNIRGLRLVLTPETAKGAKIDAAWMKSYTGREPQTSRGAYGDRSVTWKPSGIIFNASNHYLEYDAEDTAVAERTQVIEFEKQFLRGDPQRDDELPWKIKTFELPIVLNWALEGLRRHGSRRTPLKSPELCIAPKIVEWSKRYRIAQDHVGQFITDAIAENHLVALLPDIIASTTTSHFVSLKVVLALYKSWCRAEEIKKPMGRNQFNAHLRAVYGWKDVKSGDVRWQGYTSPICDVTATAFIIW